MVEEIPNVHTCLLRSVPVSVGRFGVCKLSGGPRLDPTHDPHRRVFMLLEYIY